MKKLLIALSLVVMSCVSSNRTPYDDSRGDEDARYAQSIMKNAVKFEETITVKAAPTFGSAAPVEFNFNVVGSGVVVDVNKETGTSMILTAWHVCDRYPVGFKIEDLFASYEITAEKQEVITVDEKRLEILDVLYQRKEDDTCVVEVKHLFESHAALADEMPPRGGFVDVVGAPMGEWGPHMVSMQSGRYYGLTAISLIAGITDTKPTYMPDFAYYGFAGVGGYSGSGVYYKGKLIGIHTAGSGRYEHASYGPSIWAIKRAIKKSRY